MHLNAQIHAKMCQNASLNDYSRKPSSGTKMKNETENTHVNWIRAALKVAVRYIDCVLNINQKTKSLIALHRRSFVALTRNKGSLILTVKTMQCFTFN